MAAEDNKVDAEVVLGVELMEYVLDLDGHDAWADHVVGASGVLCLLVHGIRHPVDQRIEREDKLCDQRKEREGKFCAQGVKHGDKLCDEVQNVKITL